MIAPHGHPIPDQWHVRSALGTAIFNQARTIIDVLQVEIGDVVRQVDCRLDRRRLQREGEEADALEYHSCKR